MAKEQAMVTRSRKWSRLGASAVVATLLAAVVLPESLTAAQQSCGPPPPAAPQRRTGGESFPPLPLPATPVRRTEPKREPAPPALIGKVAYVPPKWVTQDGKRFQYRDWTTDPGDMATLLNWTNAQLGIRYRSEQIDLDTFSYDPAELPVLYFTGHEAVNLDAKQIARLQRYVLDGGFILGDACCGSTAFYTSFRALVRTLFPDRECFQLPEDHPLFSAFYRVTTVQYQDEKKGTYTAAPVVYGVNIGCRTAVLFWPADLSCGWDGHVHTGGFRMAPDPARQLGANLVTYILANYQLGRFLATEKVYYQAGERTRDEFVFAQVVHDGDWDPSPSAVMNLLKSAAASTTMEVQFKRATVQLAGVDAFAHPFLYMTGHRDFRLTEAEVKQLRAYLTSGGLLLADSCCGRQGFDTAFRREMARVLPGKELTALPLDHPVYGSRFKIERVQYSDLVRQKAPGLTAPTLEGIDYDGQAAVIYSRYGLGAAWDEYERPYARSYAPADALRLGVNVLVYAMTH
jgi:hypothetical protein